MDARTAVPVAEGAALGDLNIVAALPANRLHPQRRGDLWGGVAPVGGRHDPVGQRRQEFPHLGMRHEVEQMRVGDRGAHRDEVVRDVVDEGDRARVLAAQLPDRRAFGRSVVSSG